MTERDASGLLLMASALLFCMGCQGKGVGQSKSEDSRGEDAEYFSSPEAAVPIVTELLRAHDWKRLAKYYDVAAGSSEEVALRSGSGFFRPREKGSASAAMGGEYVQPFSPGARYVSTSATDEAGVVEVTVALDIDQGGGMVQRGVRTFRMRRTSAGYQLMLAAVPAAGASVPVGAEEELMIAYRPAIAEKVRALPAADVGALPALLEELGKWRRHEQVTAASSVAAVKRRVPTDEELMQSVIGERISAVINTSDSGNVVKTLTAAGHTEESITYPHVGVHRVEVAGKEPVLFADTPEVVKLMLPKKDTGF
jgi:hypothetical protein